MEDLDEFMQLLGVRFVGTRQGELLRKYRNFATGSREKSVQALISKLEQEGFKYDSRSGTFGYIAYSHEADNAVALVFAVKRTVAR